MSVYQTEEDTVTGPVFANSRKCNCLKKEKEKKKEISVE